MPAPTESVTAMALGLALDAASLRQQAIASNIANAGAADYTPMSVDFDSQLEDARRTLESGGRLDMDTLADVSPQLQVAAPSDLLGLSPKVMLDVEVGRLSQNAVQYEALIKGLSKHYAILSTAFSDGKK